MRYIRTTVKEYRTGITTPDATDPTEKVNCLWAKECWFYIHVVSGTVNFVGVRALFEDSKEGAYVAGAIRENMEPPIAIVVDVKGHEAIALKVINLSGTNPNIKINYDLVQEA